MNWCAGRLWSRGDVEPCAVVGRELLRRGHEVRIAVPPNMFGLADSAGLAAVAYEPDSQAQLDTAAEYFVSIRFLFRAARNGGTRHESLGGQRRGAGIAGRRAPTCS